MKNFAAPFVLDKIKLKYVKTLVHRVSAKTGHLEKAAKDKKIIARLRDQVTRISFKFRTVFDSSNSYFIILDRQMNILDYNKASFRFVKRLFGKKMILGDNILDFIHPTSAKMVTESCDRALAGERFILERKIVYLDKVVTWWAFEFSPTKSLNGKITGVVFDANDITKRVAYEEKIMAQHKRLTEIASIQSHEIRGPVCTIMGLMSLIKSENYPPDKEYLLLLDITTNLLDQNIRDIVKLANEG